MIIDAEIHFQLWFICKGQLYHYIYKVYKKNFVFKRYFLESRRQRKFVWTFILQIPGDFSDFTVISFYLFDTDLSQLISS